MYYHSVTIMLDSSLGLVWIDLFLNI